MTSDRVAFAARRRRLEDEYIARLEPVIGRALDRKQAGADTWWRPVVDAAKPLFDQVLTDDGASPAKAAAAWALASLDLAHTLAKTRNIDEYSHTVIATLVAGYLISAATVAAARQDGEPFELEWVSMHDSKVRHTHRVADGQRVKPSDPFLVGGVQMRFPRDTRAPVSEWINCRCTVAATPVEPETRHAAAAAVHTDPRREGAEPMNPTVDLAEFRALVAAMDAAADDGLIPWHGPLAPEGVWSGDRRRFNDGSLDHRDLPLPLTYQDRTADAHDDAATVASIDWMEKRDGVMHGGGRVLQNEDADKFVGMLAHFGRLGVSVDADQAEGGLANEDGTAFDLDSDGEPYGHAYDMARICSACAVNIPAFAEAWVTLGLDPDHDYGDAGGDSQPVAAAGATLTYPEMTNHNSAVFAGISEKSWDGSASRFTPEQYKRSCVLHRCDGLEKSCHSLPIREPDGTLSRAGVHAAASRVDQVKDATDAQKAAAKRAIRSAYKTLGEDPPEGFALTEDQENAYLELYLDLVTAGRGPGWLTNPEDTKRIHDYWTVPGEEGYAKIGWGTPGDFNRCRVEVGQEIGEDSPAKLRFLNQICAQWHHDALGRWPAEDKAVEALETDDVMAPGLTIVASTGPSVLAPHEWFEKIEFDRPTPLQITDDGHIFGHVSQWGVCHMAFNAPGQCINPEPSKNDYAYFRNGEVMTDAGPVATGPVTLGTGHAHLRASMRPALAHYDNTGTAVADVIAWDDDHGIAINGWVRPWISDEKKYELRAHPPSGDWRLNPNTGDMDMIAVLSVNAPGLPVRRVGFNDGKQVSLLASLGTVEPTVTDDDGVDEFAEKLAVHLASALADLSAREKADAEARLAFARADEQIHAEDRARLAALEVD